MVTVIIDRKIINSELLTDEIVATYPNAGISFGQDVLHVRAIGATETAIQAIIAAHNPNTRTTRQSKEDTENADIDAFLALEFNPTNEAHLTLMYKVLKSIVARR